MRKWRGGVCWGEEKENGAIDCLGDWLVGFVVWMYGCGRNKGLGISRKKGNGDKAKHTHSDAAVPYSSGTKEYGVATYRYICT